MLHFIRKPRKRKLPDDPMLLMRTTCQSLAQSEHYSDIVYQLSLRPLDRGMTIKELFQTTGLPYGSIKVSVAKMMKRGILISVWDMAPLSRHKYYRINTENYFAVALQQYVAEHYHALEQNKGESQ